MPSPSGRVRFIVMAGGTSAGNINEATARSIPARSVAAGKRMGPPKTAPPARQKASPVLRERPVVPVKSRPGVRRVKKPPRHLSKAAVHPRVSRRHEIRKQPTLPTPPARASLPQPTQAAPGSASPAKAACPDSGGGGVAGDTARSGAPAASAGGGPVTAGLGTDKGPRFIHQVKPAYPRLARRLGKEGTVLLQVTIDKRGRPIHVQVVKGAGYGFDDQARKAVQDSLFAPARKAGRAVRCKVLLSVRFVLRSSP
jgi:protein TonB